MSLPRTIFLVGPMGAGKSAVGQKLAQITDRQFVDTDAMIEERCGVDISFIFEKEGEAGFREREHNMLEEVAGKPGSIIATGGGIVTHEPNLAILSRDSIVIYLKTSVEQQNERTRYGNTRPLLDHDDPLEKLRQLLAIRGPIYESLADLVICTDGRHVKQVASTIAHKLDNFDGKKKP